MVDLMTDDIEDFPQREFTEEKGVGLKNRRKFPQPDASNAVALHIHLKTHIHQEIPVIAVPL